jgi:hypothetical protein
VHAHHEGHPQRREHRDPSLPSSRGRARGRSSAPRAAAIAAHAAPGRGRRRRGLARRGRVGGCRRAHRSVRPCPPPSPLLEPGGQRADVGPDPSRGGTEQEQHAAAARATLAAPAHAVRSRPAAGPLGHARSARSCRPLPACGRAARATLAAPAHAVRSRLRPGRSGHARCARSCRPLPACGRRPGHARCARSCHTTPEEAGTVLGLTLRSAARPGTWRGRLPRHDQCDRGLRAPAAVQQPRDHGHHEAGGRGAGERGDERRVRFERRSRLPPSGTDGSGPAPRGGGRRSGRRPARDEVGVVHHHRGCEHRRPTHEQHPRWTTAGVRVSPAAYDARVRKARAP